MWFNFVKNERAMHTLSKQQVGNWMLLDYLSQRQLLESKIGLFTAKYQLDFDVFEQQIEQATTENFDAWDDYIEWKAYNHFLSELTTKIDDVKHGHFQMA